jgi:protein-L-isoaspartate(D-aspartate) O-methyltransferase
MGAELNDTDFALLRHRMVDDQLRARHIGDERILAVMEKVPRHHFVPAAHRRAAYDDGPLPIGLGQTISQPYMVARMTELLRLTSTDRVLEIGTGSGYQAAVLAELAGSVWTIERHPELARRAEELLLQLGYDNVQVMVGDGTLGLAQAAPYDGIMVTAAGPCVPRSLRGQLAINGRMVIPVSAGFSQDLRLVERLSDVQPAAGALRDRAEAPEPCFRETSILGCVFVPLVGKEGYEG